jgi:redox-sensitive bicupin YhaK (pirin superfamily)
MTMPRYQEVKSTDIPEVTDDDGTKVRVICGSFWGRSGPVDGVAAEPQYLDIWVPPGLRRSLPVAASRNAFAYVFGGSGQFANASDLQPVRTDRIGGGAEGEDADNRSLVVFDSGDEITVQSGEQGIRFLLVSGTPIKEPVAWRGPIVMNTNEELRQAFEEFRAGTFLKHG